MITMVPCCYHDLKIMETKNSFPVTYPNVFRLRDQNTQIWSISIWILLNEESNNSLVTAWLKNKIKTLPFFMYNLNHSHYVQLYMLLMTRA